jgi:elongation factor G
MKEYTTDALRNIVLLGHSSSGKTSLGEAMLFNAKAITRMGRIEEGNTVGDFDEEEIRRRISINSALLPVEWNNHKLNVLDTPGFLDFVSDVMGAVQVADSALLVIDGVSGIEVGTELGWGYAADRKLPAAVVINKLDRDNSNFSRVLNDLRNRFQANFVPLFLPIGSESSFSGVVDLIRMKARAGAEGSLADIPDDLLDEVAESRTQVIEAAAEGDDELLMKYLDGQELSAEEINLGLRAGIRNRTVIPVLCSAATHDIAVAALLDTLVDVMPSPADAGSVKGRNPKNDEEVEVAPASDKPLAALVFKTTADPFVGRITYFRVFRGALSPDSRVFNSTKEEEERIGQVYVMRGKEQIGASALAAGDIGAITKLSVTTTGDTLCDKEQRVVLDRPHYPDALIAIAIEPKTKADSAKMGPTLTRLAEEDPTLRWRQDASIKQTILEGMGDSHLDVAVRRAHSKFGVELVTKTPRVPYRESITKTAEATYRHKKQTGGAGQFGEVAMRVEPYAEDAGYAFVWEVFGGAISSSYQTSIEKGIRSVMEEGVIAGYPVVNVKCAVFDGKEHAVDSKPVAFEIAGREAFKLCVLNANPVLLEPIVDLRIIVPDNYMGDVIGDLNTKRARVQGMDQDAGKAIVTAQAPLAEVQRYATDLRSITQGRGIFTLKFSHYETVPPHIAEGVIQSAKKEAETTA